MQGNALGLARILLDDVMVNTVLEVLAASQNLQVLANKVHKQVTYVRLMNPLLFVAAADLQRQRRFRDRHDPFALEDSELISRTCFPRHVLIDLVNVLTPMLSRRTNRNCSVTVAVQLSIALRFYATGVFLRETGDLHGVSKNTASLVLHAVCNALSTMAKDVIRFPTTDRELREVALAYFRMQGIPNVCGAIDGSQIAIKRPHVNEHVYVNRKGYHAINVQAVCTADFLFANIVVRFPGSTHDSFIWNTCALRQKFVAGEFGSFFLLGDSGYAQRPWLMTPVRNPATPAQVRYNNKHTGTQFKIENAFGIWKSRFRCIDKSGGALQYSPQRCCKIITATAVRNGVPLPPQQDIEQAVDRERRRQQRIIVGDDTVDGVRARDLLMERL